MFARSLIRFTFLILDLFLRHYARWRKRQTSSRGDGWLLSLVVGRFCLSRYSSLISLCRLADGSAPASRGVFVVVNFGVI